MLLHPVRRSVNTCRSTRKTTWSAARLKPKALASAASALMSTRAHTVRLTPIQTAKATLPTKDQDTVTSMTTTAATEDAMSDKSDDPRDAIATRELQNADWDERRELRKQEG